MIQSQAALTCASCARSLGSGNRCPGVVWSGVLVLLLPSFSSLSSMDRKLINFQSCTTPFLASLGNCQGWASISSSRNQVALPLILLLQPHLEVYYFLWSSFFHALWLKSRYRRIFRGGALDDILSSITVYEARWNCFKNL